MQKDPANYCTNSAKQTIMSSSQPRNSKVSKGVPPRPVDTVYDTGVEGCESPGDVSGDCDPGSNSTLGNPAPDGPGDEGRSISLRHVTTPPGIAEE